MGEKASAEARQVVSRMFGSGDKGLLMMVRQMWNDLYIQEKKEMEADEAMQRANESFSKLSAARKRTIKSVAERTNSWEQEMIMFKSFTNQLESGISTTPRSGKKGPASSKPPAIPQ